MIKAKKEYSASRDFLDQGFKLLGFCGAFISLVVGS